MSDKKYNSSSDDSDEDYVPPDATEQLSEEENSGDSDPGVDNEETPRKRRKKEKEVADTKSEKKVDKVIDKQAVWKEFKEETKNKTPSTATATNSLASKTVTEKRPTVSGGGGLASIIGQLGKKGKLSTLEQSKLDWMKFKKNEGIEDEIKAHNKGREGFLERRDFLERTDLRQFEIEKELRAIKRSNR